MPDQLLLSESFVVLSQHKLVTFVLVTNSQLRVKLSSSEMASAWKRIIITHIILLKKINLIKPSLGYSVVLKSLNKMYNY